MLIMSHARCPSCGDVTTVDGDRPVVMLLILVARSVVLGGLAYLLVAWLIGATAGVVAGVVVVAVQFLNVGWVVKRGATTCHRCRTTFETR